MPLQRYPGGNFVSSYQWEDGVGPRDQRPTRLDLAWRALEPNAFGTDEFILWCRQAGAAPYMCINLGTRGAAEAQALVEYCNHPAGTALSERRKQNVAWLQQQRRERRAATRTACTSPQNEAAASDGSAGGDAAGAECGDDGRDDAPHGVKLWALGNEMDGSWQACAKSACEYGKIALEAAKLMRRTDPSIELVACGSSGSWMRTFGAWEAEVLEIVHGHVDFISLHAYYANRNGDTAAYLRRLDEFAQAIRAVASTIDHVAARKRAAGGGGGAGGPTSRPVHIAVDEWNSWWGQTEPMRAPRKPPSGSGKAAKTPATAAATTYPETAAGGGASDGGGHGGEWTVGRRLLEETYAMEDALLVGGMLIVMINHCDRVRLACLAQTVNAIAPIMTTPGGGAWRQAAYWPFYYTSKFGRGRVLRLSVEGAAASDGGGMHPFLVLAAVLAPTAEELRVFAVNRHLREEVELDLTVCGLSLSRAGGGGGDKEMGAAGNVLEWVELRHDQLTAANTAEEPNRVHPTTRPGARVDAASGRVRATLKPASWNMLRVQLARGVS